MIVSSMRQMQLNYQNNNNTLRRLNGELALAQREYSRQARQYYAEEAMARLAMKQVASNATTSSTKEWEVEAQHTSIQWNQFKAQMDLSRAQSKVQNVRERMMRTEGDNHLLKANIMEEINKRMPQSERLSDIPEQMLVSARSFDAFIRTKNAGEEKSENYGEAVQRKRIARMRAAALGDTEAIEQIKEEEKEA